jgi:hypothetical protein
MVKSNRARSFYCVKSWEIIADNLHKAGWSLGWVSAVDSEGRTIWIVDAHGYGKRFIVRADEMLTAFVELETATSLLSRELNSSLGASKGPSIDDFYTGMFNITAEARPDCRRQVRRKVPTLLFCRA